MIKGILRTHRLTEEEGVFPNTYQAMIKRSLVLSTLLVGGVAFPGISLPVCYMQSQNGAIIDLTSMCGSSKSAVVQPAVQGVSRILEPELQPSSSANASFQVTRISSDGQATGRVNFSCTAPEGSWVTPYVVFSNGERRRLRSVTRTRGQRRTEIQFRLPPGTTTSEVEGGVF